MCWKCGNNIDIETIGRTSECSVCHADLHCCKNCLNYMPGSHYDCHETVDELVKDKERANFCEMFSPKRDFELNGSGNDDKKAKALDAFNALFS